jgi:hypothetical protein
MVAEFEAGLIRGRTARRHEGGHIQAAPARQAAQAQPEAGGDLVGLYRAGEHTVGELEELFGRFVRVGGEVHRGSSMVLPAQQR